MSFLNVDLDLRGPHPLEGIVAALGDAVAPLHREGDGAESVASLELAANPREEEVVDAILARFCDLLEALPAEARAAWDACMHRDFNLGFESWRATADTTTMAEARLSPRTLARIAALGASVTVTVYAEARD